MGAKPTLTFSDNTVTNKFFRKIKFDENGKKDSMRKGLFFFSITWVPLLILSLFEGTIIGKSVQIPLLFDFVVYVKFFVSLPILIFADRFINFQTSTSINHFLNSEIITESNFEQFEGYFRKYSDLQNSRKLELLVLFLAFVNIVLFRFFFASFGRNTSWEIPTGNPDDRTIAGYYYILICLPIWQFFVFKLLLRFFIWSWFLWKVSRMKLNLNASDPDTAGGLAFLGTAQIAFFILGFAQAASFSAEIANKSVYGGVPIDDFTKTIAISVVAVTMFYLFPLFFFMRKLATLKLEGMLEYGVLAHKYSELFYQKWIINKDETKEELLGTGDIQSLADIGGSYERISDMRIVPLDLRLVLIMIFLIVAPFLPLTLLKIPPNEIFKALVGFFF